MTTNSPGDVSEFSISVSEADLSDLVGRLEKTRFPDDYANEDWEYGFNTDYLRELVGYWAADFDWRAQERRINELSNYKTEIEGIPIHFIHERGKGPDPMPLLIHHGWPWTFWDLNKVIGPLTDPAAHGGDPADSFDVVLMSLPGYGFSSPLRETGWSFHRTTDIEMTLRKSVV